jgi:hypothetical protein
MDEHLVAGPNAGDGLGGSDDPHQPPVTDGAAAAGGAS